MTLRPVYDPLRRLPEPDRRAMCAWLTAHDVDPATIPQDGDTLRVEVGDGGATRVRWRPMLTDPDGFHFLAANGSEIALGDWHERIVRDLPPFEVHPDGACPR